MADSKQAKLARLAAANPISPRPPVPRLAENLFEMSTDAKREEIRRFNQEWEDWHKGVQLQRIV